MSSNLLKLDSNKTELMVVAPKALLWKVGDPLFNMDECTICQSPDVCNLGVILNSTLSFQSHNKSPKSLSATSKTSPDSSHHS